jgi:hypothetical protein
VAGHLGQLRSARWGEAPRLSQLRPSVRLLEQLRTRCSMRPRTASCSCGQLRIEVQGEPLGVGSLPLPGLSASNGQCVCCASRLLRTLQGVSMATDYIRVGDQGASSSSGSALPAGRRCSTLTKVTNVSGRGRWRLGDRGFPPPRASVYDCRRHSWV